MNTMFEKGVFYVLLAAGCLFGLCGCVQELSDNDSQAENSQISKFIFTSENAVSGELMVCFEESATEQIEGFLKTKAAEGMTVMTRSGIEPFDVVLENIGVKALRRLFPATEENEARTRAAGLHRWYIVSFDPGVDLDKAALNMASVAEVSKIEFSQKLKRIASPASAPVELQTKAGTTLFNDPGLGDQWHYINTGDQRLYSGIKSGADINCAEAWRLCTGDPRVIVAIVDGGVQADHPDLAANMWVNNKEIPGNGIDDDGNGFIDDVHGFDFVNNKPQTIVDAHGTHVAGTVAAVNNNGQGVCGVAGGSGAGDGVKLMSCQIFAGDDGGSTAISAAAIKYAADNGAAIIQCSFGYNGAGITSDNAYAQGASVEKQAIDYFIASRNCAAVDGGIVIFAAGNEMTSMSSYPGAYRDYISVTAMSCDYTPAYYTNYGPGCNIAAPGGDAYQSLLESSGKNPGSQVLSTYPDGKYGYMQGTSMACPHVSGVAALGLSYALKLGLKFSRDQFNSILLTSVNEIDSYCIGSKQYITDAGSLATLQLGGHRRNMGIGYIDAYQVLMNIRGTVCIPVATGSQATINLPDYIGGGDANMKIGDVSISAADMEKLGMTAAPTVFGSRILLTCKKSGSAIMSVKLTAGTNSGNGMYGFTTTKEFAIIARDAHSSNGGWL